ncbi:hypothetical protein TSO5_15665 [Azospirillum sp. TSO5]|nr:hypothetical protein TSO5_15665 [Azospirillum sp. TSO5]
MDGGNRGAGGQTPGGSDNTTSPGKGGIPTSAKLAVAVAAVAAAAGWFAFGGVGGEARLPASAASAIQPAKPAKAGNGWLPLGGDMAAQPAGKTAAAGTAPASPKSDGSRKPWEAEQQGPSATDVLNAASLPPAGFTAWEWDARRIDRGPAAFTFDNAGFWLRPGLVPFVAAGRFHPHPAEMAAFFAADGKPKFDGDVFELASVGWTFSKSRMLTGIVTGQSGHGVNPESHYVRLPKEARPAVEKPMEEFLPLVRKAGGRNAVVVEAVPLNRDKTAYAVGLHRNPRAVHVVDWQGNMSKGLLNAAEIFFVAAAWDGAEWRALASASWKADLMQGPHSVNAKTGEQLFLGQRSDENMVMSILATSKVFQDVYERYEGHGYITGAVTTAADRAPSGQQSRDPLDAKLTPVKTASFSLFTGSFDEGFTFGRPIEVTCPDGIVPSFARNVRGMPTNPVAGVAVRAKGVCRVPFSFVDTRDAEAPVAAFGGYMQIEVNLMGGDMATVYRPLKDKAFVIEWSRE